MINFEDEGIDQGKSVVLAGKMDLAASKENLTRYLAEVNRLKSEVEGLVVEDELGRLKAVEYGTVASSLLKKVKDTTKNEIKEADEFVKAVKQIAAPFEGSLVMIKEIAARKIKQYQSVVESKRRADEAKLQEAARELERKLKKEAEKGGFEPVSVPLPVIPKLPEKVRTETGTQYQRERWAYKVKEPYEENIAKVPPDCLSLNDANIRARIKMGARGEDIPGVIIWQDDTIVFRG